VSSGGIGARRMLRACGKFAMCAVGGDGDGLKGSAMAAILGHGCDSC
jgi:hypothetical protein